MIPVKYLSCIVIAFLNLFVHGISKTILLFALGFYFPLGTLYSDSLTNGAHSAMVTHDAGDILNGWGKKAEDSFFGYDLFENHGGVMLLVDPTTGIILDANRAAHNFYGYPDLSGKNVSQLNMSDPMTIEANLHNAQRLKQNYFHFQHKLANHEIKDVEVYSYPIEVENTEVLFSLIIDVSEKYKAEQNVKYFYKLTIGLTLLGLILLSCFIFFLLKSIRKRVIAEENLKESEKRYKELFNNAQDIVFSCDPKGNILNINKEAYKVFGGKRIIGRNIWDFIVPKAIDNTKKILKTAIGKSQNSFSFETQIIDAENDIRYLEINGYIKYNESGEEQEIFGIARNINEQRQIARNIMKTVIATEERERKRVAAELHDGIGPLLSGLKMYLQQNNLATNLNDRQQKILDYSRQLVDDAISQTRVIANNLAPSLLTDFGLEKALLSFAEKVNNINRCKVAINVKQNLHRVNANESLVIYRVSTELINNALKHAECDNVTISIELKECSLILFYSDNGIGFDVENMMGNHLKKGMGLSNIYNRVASLDGTVILERNKTKGMYAKIEIPLMGHNTQTLTKHSMSINE